MNNKLARNLKNYRDKYGLSIREIAKLMEVSYSAVSYYENGKRNPPLQYVYRLQDRLLRLPPKEFRKLVKIAGTRPVKSTFSANKKNILFTWNISRKPSDTSFVYYQK